MQISDEAVEAAAKMSQALHFAETWESLPGFLRRERLREARLTLEAAAPYMQTAGDEGELTDQVRYSEDSPRWATDFSRASARAEVERALDILDAIAADTSTGYPDNQHGSQA